MNQTELIYILALENDAHLESTLFRFNKRTKVRFVLGPTLFGQKLLLYTNYPFENEQFYREKYHKFEFIQASDSFGCYVELQFNVPGSFRFYYSIEGQDKPCGSLYLVVDPELKVGPEGNQEILILDSVCCQTVLSKCLGHFKEWKPRLEVAKMTGYNMIHFTPIQELGNSLSCYSLRDQLKLNSMFNDSNEQFTIDDVGELVKWMQREWKILSITDVVLNHTANETDWLKEHPEATYNCLNSPHLRPAFLLDRVLAHFTLDIIQGKWKEHGIDTKINSEAHLSNIRTVLLEKYLPKVKIHEFYMVNVNDVLEELKDKLIQILQFGSFPKTNIKSGEIKIIQDQEYRRLKSSIDYTSALKLIEDNFQITSLESIENTCEFLRQKIILANNEVKSLIDNHLNSAIENVIQGVRYERLQHDGPKIVELTINLPLVTQYFTYDGPLDLVKEEQMMFDSEFGKFFMAHNGWVMGDDPLRNFAESGSNVYIRRELICWSDSVKLRYGKEPKDSPFLWSYMEKYVTKMATVFHGLRLDNCHSTPIHLAEYLLDNARRANPDLYLIAELFTSDERVDNIFVNKLGINSLIREAMSAHDSHDLGRQVYRYGGEPVGSFPSMLISSNSVARPLTPSTAHAIFFDLTHDNESPILRRSPYDPLPTAALVSMTLSAIGSNRGYDELVPYQIHVVKESRNYASWNNSQDPETSVSPDVGIISVKQILNDLHKFLGINGFQQAFVDQRDLSTIAVTRHNRVTHESYVLIARTAFTKQCNPKFTGYINPLHIEGKIESIVLEAKMYGKPDEQFVKNTNIINGFRNFCAKFQQNISPEMSKMVVINSNNNNNEIIFKKFPPSSVIVFKVSLGTEHLDALNQLKQILNQFNGGEIIEIVKKLSLVDLNYVLFRCDQEEKDEGWGGGVYILPNIGSLNYCGLAGIMSHLRNIRTFNDLGHPLCGNLRDGNWMQEYIVNRLRKSQSQHVIALSQWLSQAFTQLARLPRYLIPRYFDAIVTPIYSLLLEQVWNHSSDLVKNGSKFIELLALGGVALYGLVKSSPLPPLSPKIAIKNSIQPTLAAGLPHFSTGYMRNWGRDTFISLKGLLLVTGRHEEAKRTILGFAGTLRHGLIPNLLDGGVNARYNCRDAVWWWLQSIKDYCTIVPNGISILQQPVKRLYPTDDSSALIDDENLIEQSLSETMQEALERHFAGIDFIERNAGLKIDAHMKQEGFHVCVGVNRETGFVYGGNEWNCGTWMDKMGSSEKAGNKGKPGTPRDGSAVELIGLCKSVVSWIETLHSKGLWNYDGVGKELDKWSWSQWSQSIQNNFESRFYVSESDSDPLINKRKIYKDSFGATHQWQDFQLRPNFLISMVVAPELFQFDHAYEALEIVENTLVGPLGMKTLDPSDWNYRGDYDNSNDSTDYHIAHGFNYHQGPEWLWLMGFYLQARLMFAKDMNSTVNTILKKLSIHFQYLETSHWYGLPELTNSNGKHCHHSCAIQSWSHATILQVFHAISQFN